MRRLALMLLALSIPATAVAQPALTPPRAPAPERRTVEPYSPSTALALSLGTTLAGYGAIAVGATTSNDALQTAGAVAVTFGPSTGHWYTGHLLTRGLGLRAGAVVAAGAAVAVALSECPLFSDEECHESATAPILLVAASVLWIGGTVDDIVTAPGEARRRNRDALQISIAPTVTPHQAGLAVVGSF